MVPGPSAVVSALAVSGLPTGRFTFEGFLSVNKKSRKEHLEGLKGERRTMVFYEAPHKLSRTLADMLAAWGDRRVALARELTKIHEEIIRTTLSEAAHRYADGSARGEFVLVIEGAPEPKPVALPEQDAFRLAQKYLAGGLSASEAAKRAAGETGRKKGELYRDLVRQKKVRKSKTPLRPHRQAGGDFPCKKVPSAWGGHLFAIITRITRIPSG